VAIHGRGGAIQSVGAGCFRIAAADYTVAAGTSRAKTIPQGSLVLAALQSAMFDSNNIDEPSEFRIDRPPYTYMLFGYGLTRASVST
jgi:cytochrome P450